MSFVTYVFGVTCKTRTLSDGSFRATQALGWMELSAVAAVQHELSFNAASCGRVNIGANVGSSALKNFLAVL